VRALEDAGAAAVAVADGGDGGAVVTAELPLPGGRGAVEAGERALQGPQQLASSSAERHYWRCSHTVCRQLTRTPRASPHPPPCTAPPRAPGGPAAGADAVVFRLRPDGAALFRMAATGAAAGRPDPPFCVTRGCISGPAERGRLEALRDALGWVALEPDGGADAVWTQILLH
jgi:hypothetical protein